MRLSRTLQTLAEAYQNDHIVVFRTVIFDALDPIHYAKQARLLFNRLQA